MWTTLQTPSQQQLPHCRIQWSILRSYLPWDAGSLARAALSILKTVSMWLPEHFALLIILHGSSKERKEQSIGWTGISQVSVVTRKLGQREEFSNREGIGSTSGVEGSSWLCTDQQEDTVPRQWSKEEMDVAIYSVRSWRWGIYPRDRGGRNDKKEQRLK